MKIEFVTKLLDYCAERITLNELRAWIGDHWALLTHNDDTADLLAEVEGVLSDPFGTRLEILALVKTVQYNVEL